VNPFAACCDEQSKLPDFLGSTGFAALPHDLGIAQLRRNAYCESLERWILNSIWDQGNIPLEKVEIREDLYKRIFSGFKGRLHCFKVVIDSVSEIDFFENKNAVFYYCILETPTGGAIPGSACGCEDDPTVFRAILETFTNTVVCKRLAKYSLAELTDILEQRIVFFANDSQGFAKVTERINSKSGFRKLKPPPIEFSSQLPGPWNPEIEIYRIVLKGSFPFVSGGINRFVI